MFSEFQSHFFFIIVSLSTCLRDRCRNVVPHRNRFPTVVVRCWEVLHSASSLGGPIKDEISGQYAFFFCIIWCAKCTPNVKHLVNTSVHQMFYICCTRCTPNSKQILKVSGSSSPSIRITNTESEWLFFPLD